MIGERVYTEDKRHRYGTVEEYSPYGFNHWIVKWDGDNARERVYGSDLRSLDPDSDPTKITDLTRWHLERCVYEMERVELNAGSYGWLDTFDPVWKMALKHLHDLDQGNV